MPLYGDKFVDRFLDPWNRHDVDGALALMTDDCVWLQHLSGFSDQECAGWTPAAMRVIGQAAAAVAAISNTVRFCNRRPEHVLGECLKLLKAFKAGIMRA